MVQNAFGKYVLTYFNTFPLSFTTTTLDRFTASEFDQH